MRDIELIKLDRFVLLANLCSYNKIDRRGNESIPSLLLIFNGSLMMLLVINYASNFD